MKTIITQLFLLFSVSIFAQNSMSLSLDEAVNFALENNISVKNAKLSVLDAEQRIYENRAIGLPKVNFTAGYNYFLEVPTSLLSIFPNQNLFLAQNADPTGQPIPVLVTEIDSDGNPVFGDPQELSFGVKNNITAGLEASSLLFDYSYLTALKAARTYKDYSNSQLSVVQTDVKNKVIDAYLPALIIQENLNILDSNIVNLNQLLFETEESYKAGFVEQLDVDRLRLSISNIEVQREALARQADVVNNGLKLAMNMDINETIELTDDIESLLTPTDAALVAGDIDISNRPELAVIDQGLALSELNVDLNKGAYYPSLVGFINYQQQFQADQIKDGKWFPSSVAGLQLNVPIFAGFGTKAKIERAKIALATSQNQKTEFVNAVKMQISTARTSYISAQDRVNNQKDNLALAERIYNVSKVKYTEGVGSSLEISSAEQQLYQTQQAYTQALYDLLSAKFALQKALGQ